MNINFLKEIRSDLPAAVVVFLVALPLCLGIALGSGAPLFSGIIAGIAGGIVVGLISGSPLSVSGPAAGLTVIVAGAIGKMPSYEIFLCSVIIAGLFQLMLGQLKAGLLGDFIPSTVIKGMLAAIGIILILKQFPHAVGWDADFEGDEEFLQADGHNSFSELFFALRHLTPLALLISAFSIFIQWGWEQPFLSRLGPVKTIPAPLLVVVSGFMLQYFAGVYFPEFALGKEHMVNIPVADSAAQFLSFFRFPDWSGLTSPQVWISGLTIGIVASLESLLSVEATDKLDPQKRSTPNNRELMAQGAGNLVSGLLGGLPVTAVIVRSSANLHAGARSKASAVIHGILLLICVFAIPDFLNRIPLAALAGILMFVGFKLTKPSIYQYYYHKGRDQLMPFLVTVLAILFTDLLIGILIGIIAALFYIMRSNFRTAILVVRDGNHFLIRFRKEVSFLNKPVLKKKLAEIPEGGYVLFDATRSGFIDKDVVELVEDFASMAGRRNIKIEFKKDHRNELTHFSHLENMKYGNA